MNRLAAVTLILLLEANTAWAAPLSFSYGGRLTQADQAVEGPVDLELRFYRSGSKIATASFSAVKLIDGVFQVEVTPAQVGNTLDGPDDVYVEVVDKTSGTTYPQQRLVSMPFAMYANKVPVDESTLSFGSDGKLKVVNPYSGQTPNLSAANITSGSFTTDRLADGAVTTAKIAAGAVTADKLAGAIAPSKIATDSANRFVTETQIAAWNSNQSSINATSNIALNDLTANGQLVLNNDAANAGVTLKAQDNLSTAYTLTLPANAGSNNDVLQVGSSGELRWVAIPSAPVTKVAGRTGDVTLTASDISGSIANSKLDTIITAGKVSGDAITSGTIGGLTQFTGSGGVDTTGEIKTTSSPISGYGNFVVKASSTATTDLRFNAKDNTKYVGFKAPDTIATSKIWTLPNADGGNGQVLATDGSGSLSWIAPNAGSVTSVTAIDGLWSSNSGGAVTLAVDVGTTANKIVQLDADSKLPAVDGSALINLSAIKLQGHAVTATAPTPNQVLKWNGSAWAPGSDEGGVAGAINNGANLGTSSTTTADIFDSVASSSINFRRLSEGSGIDLTQNTNDVTIALANDAVTTTHIKDDTISNADISSSAAIMTSKLAGPVTSIAGHGLGALATLSIVTTGEITDGTIVNTDISSAAAIADTKLATIATAGKVSGAAITSGAITGTASFTGSGGVNTSGSMTASANIIVNAASGAATELRFNDADNSNWLAFKSPATVATNITWTLPATDGANNQFLTTNGTGTLSWASSAAPTGAAGGDLAGSYPNPTLKSSSDDTVRPVTSNHIRDSAITSAKIMDNTIATADIADSAVTDAKLATISTPGKVSGGAIITGTIAGNAAFNGSGGINTTGNLLTTGNVGIGTNSPSDKLVVKGAARNDEATSNTTTTIDFSKSNLQYYSITDSSCTQSFSLSNLNNGGSYTFVVKGNSSSTCNTNLSIYLNLSGSLKFRWLEGPDTATINFTTNIANPRRHTIFGLMVIGSDVYVTASPGY